MAFPAFRKSFPPRNFLLSPAAVNQASSPAKTRAMQKKAEQPTIATKERGILTTAFGDRPYLNRALSLARSCHFHSPQAPLAIITDQPEDKGLRRHFDYILPFTQPQDHSKSLSWKSFEHKLHLDKLSPFKKTIFLDSDCLLYADVSNLFERFAGHVFQPSDLSILPPRYVQGCCKRWLMDLNKVCRHYDIRTLLSSTVGAFTMKMIQRSLRLFLQRFAKSSNYARITIGSAS